MGVTYIKGTVSSGKGRTEKVEFLVDSGAQYTVLPEKVWKALKLKAKRTESFVLADGTKVNRQMSECHIQLPQGDCTTPVVLGEPGDATLLGVVTLEELGLMLNPFSRALVHMRLMMACLLALAGWGLPALAQDMPLTSAVGGLIDGEGWQLLSEGHAFTEGPAANKDGNVFVTDILNNRIHKNNLDGKVSVFAENTAKTNGLMFGPDGRQLLIRFRHGGR